MMHEKSISFKWEEYDSPDELEPDDKSLLELAGKAAMNAYAPYSGFRVGAALRLKSGTVVTGTNVENAAFPSGICAERNAIASASANHPGDRPVALAITAVSGGSITDEPVSPCGNCRQVIAEEEYRYGKSMRLILGARNNIRIIVNAGDLLPLQFNSDSLKITPH
ncbi:MAG TPA: cytidine deaminase [Bacteroidales bacterium]|nr:cytidine deaminase [Bacteroidales bacterium]HPF02837.1 cytidine deaminase [Bacteroidales bacterium]HPJ60239.1 cytidine deaminase [Bacteroidales bacterium]HPR13438.1 cytidine deaminase [Bacteroidales bacterium]